VSTLRKPIAALLMGASLGTLFLAADHQDAPASKADLAADITDVYAWHNKKNDSLVTVLNFAGFASAGAAAVYDPDVLYTINIDNDGDNSADRAIHVRFGENRNGKFGVKVKGLPGHAKAIVGKVETVIEAGNGRRVYAGLRDDPFFFDLDGFKSTVQTGTLQFDKDRDTFAGLNVTSIVLKMKLSDVTANGKKPNIAVWATTSRLPEAPDAVGSISKPATGDVVVARN
jgi:hypothetical protein